MDDDGGEHDRDLQFVFLYGYDLAGDMHALGDHGLAVGVAFAGRFVAVVSG